jgi:hypothetical protein
MLVQAIQARTCADVVRAVALPQAPVAAVDAVTVFGVLAVSFMMVMYALEARHAGFVLAFVVGCLLSSVYGFLSGAWPFGVVEIIWAGVAFKRYQALRADDFAKRS